MADRSKLFDYNTSFLVTRTNPLLTGNVKITLDSSGNAYLNSINANAYLSNEKFKNYSINGKNSYATDLYRFLDEGKVKPETLFDISKRTSGETKSVDDFSLQYDFFYGAGANTLIDKNLSEPFSYFAPLWLKNELPEFFVIFKTPGPLSYPYSTNVPSGSLLIGGKYKVVSDINSGKNDYVIGYGQDSLGNPIEYKNGEFFKTTELYGTKYSIISGSGKVTLMEELKFQEDVNNIDNYFNEKILKNSSVVETFDLRSGTLIGDYIRGIVNDQAFPNGPIDFNFGDGSYTYYYGVDYQNGNYSKSGELLYDYLVSSESTPMIDFESYVSSGFARNGIVSTNIINLEFAFDDKDSDLYTINRYFGMYVSRNDLGSFRMDGDLYYNKKDDIGNNNTPQPKRNNIGYYYNNTPYAVESSSGIRLYYEGATGWIPGSDDTNINDPNKLYYITDKYEKFHSLKRTENYGTGEDKADYEYGTYSSTLDSFGLTGNTGADKGNLVISDTLTNLLDFTGLDNFVASIPVVNTGKKGHSYIDIEFNKIYDLPKSIVFKFFWTGGSTIEHGRKYDLIYSGDYSGILPWIKGSFYNFGETRVFNPYDGTPTDIANSFSSLIRDFAGYRVDSGNTYGTSIIRSNIPGIGSNNDFSVSVFYDYDTFKNNYLGLFDPEYSYVDGNIVIDSSDNYLIMDGGSWTPYNTFNITSGYGSIGGIDFSNITSNVSFTGGTDYTEGRVSFSNNDSSVIKVGNWIQTSTGYKEIVSITRYVDSPLLRGDTVVGFKNVDLMLTANLRESSYVIKLGNDSKIGVYSPHTLYSGVFTFFDVKEFDYDFWTSNYSNTPIEETRRYYYLKSGEAGTINPSIPYYLKRGSIEYNGIIYQEGTVFTGNVSSNYFTDLKKSGVDAILIPAPFTQIASFGTGQYGTDIKYEDNLESFSGFYGIEAIYRGKTTEINVEDKSALFNFGSLDTEYEYLEENYNIKTANISRIVPYINKWALVGGTDARGNPYRLNSSPAFSPTNFSPSIDRETPDPAYLTHEGFILESLPRNYPVSEVNNQNSYLPSAPNYMTIKNADPQYASYFNEVFTVSSLDYPGDYSNDSGLTKEFFGAFSYNEASGFYEVVFRGIKYVLKRKADNTEGNDTVSFINNYRGFDSYKFTTILKVIPEDNSIIQTPVKYEIIENVSQRSILFLITVVLDDYRTRELEITNDGTTVIDYTLLYSISDKKKLNIQTSGQQLNLIADTKLSAGLDLSYSSDSFVNTLMSPGRIYTINNTEYDTDLREEIKLTYAEGSNKTSASVGSFNVPQNTSDYPWPIGVAKDFVEFGKLNEDYLFTIPFLGATSGVTIPAGSQALYSGKPVFQRGGGMEYFDHIVSRISMGQIAKKINLNDPYIDYSTYIWDETTETTKVISNQFSLSIEAPSYYQKPIGPYPIENTTGPLTLGGSKVTSYTIGKSKELKTDLLRFGGFYEPIAKKVIMFRSDKNDTISGDQSKDLSFRNATFGPNKNGFGIISNLNYTKVSLDDNILSATKNLPEGPVYPLVGQTPIDKKNFSIFYSSWDPGYYDLYTTALDKTSVAGTRSMLENKSFFGSKIMKTPDRIRIDNFIGMEVSKFSGSSDINYLNQLASNSLYTIQNMAQTQNGDGTGQLPKAFIGVDIEKLDESIYPNVEFFWQNTIDPFKNDVIIEVNGIIRIDRMLSRYLLNSGVKKDFIDNMISEYGVGDPASIEDDILTYINLNVIPIYESNIVNFYVKSASTEFKENNLTVRGDIIPSYRSRTGFINDKKFSLSKRSDLVYEFSYRLDTAKYYSLNFSFDINKI